MRLIEADEVQKELIDAIDWLREEDYETYSAIGDNIVFVLDKQPTAYDIYKVVERLKERTEFLRNCKKYGNQTKEEIERSHDTMMMYEVAELVEDLIDIVKGGGIDG